MSRPRIVAVVPAYNVAGQLGQVLLDLPELIDEAIVVDDASSDETSAVAEAAARQNPRITVIRHSTNLGVGGAMVTGFQKALESGADVVVKVDGDGQMPIGLAPQLIEPLLRGEADYAKGNRFRDFQSLRRMPLVRRVGNMALSFLAKAATGYWQTFDPTNGYVAIRGDVLALVPLHSLDRGYFFETSMLSRLYLLGAVVRDVPMPARYAGEKSNLSVVRVLWQFPFRLLVSLMRRLVLKNFVYDFNLETLHLTFGTILFGAGVIYGGYNWIWHYLHRIAAPTGTVVLPAVLIILGFQLLLSAANLDLFATPKEPINSGPLR